MRCWHDRDTLLGDVDTQFETAFVDGGEMFFQFLCRFVTDVQVYAIQAAFFISKSIARATTSRGARFRPFVVLGHITDCHREAETAKAHRG